MKVEQSRRGKGGGTKRKGDEDRANKRGQRERVKKVEQGRRGK